MGDSKFQLAMLSLIVTVCPICSIHSANIEVIVHNVKNFTRFQCTFVCSVNIIVEDLNRSDTSCDDSDYDEWSLDSCGSPEHPEVTQQFDEK